MGQRVFWDKLIGHTTVPVETLWVVQRCIVLREPLLPSDVLVVFGYIWIAKDKLVDDGEAEDEVVEDESCCYDHQRDERDGGNMMRP